MSTTLDDLIQRERLIRFDLGDPQALDIRRVFMLPSVEGQIAERVSGSVSDRQLEISPEEQLYALLADFCEGEHIDAETQAKCLRPLEHGIWELKTPDLRLFGWFQHIDCFIWCSVDAKYRLLEIPGLYTGYIQEVIRIRGTLFGHPPGHIEGSSKHDVISAKR